MHSLHDYLQTAAICKETRETYTFLIGFDNFLDAVNIMPGKLIILGAFNIDVYSPEKHHVAQIHSVNLDW